MDHMHSLYYPVFIGLGLTAGFISLKLLNYKKSYNSIHDILPIIIIGALIGSKIPLILSYGYHMDIILFGKSYYGAILGGFLAINLYKYIYKKPSGLGDRFVIPLAMGAGIGKIGCFLQGCCSGTPTNFIFKVKNFEGVYVHPVQIYESIFEFSMVLLFIYFYKNNKLKNQQFLLYTIFYMIFRFLIEFIRIEPKVFYSLSVYQLMSIIFIPVFTTILIRRNNNVSTINQQN